MEDSNINIDDTDITVRTYSFLRKMGIQFLNDLKEYTFDDLKAVNNISRKHIDEILRLLSTNGLALKDGLGTITITEECDFNCLCGNTREKDGFYTCLENGSYVEPDIESEWKDKYFCSSCGRVITQTTGKVVTQMSDEKLSIQLDKL